MNELVTGEAVVLGLRPARLPSRALAVLIDLTVAWAAYIAVSIALFAATGSLDPAAVAALSVAAFVLVLIGIPIVVETLSHGRSLGKLACGLRVVREDGGPVRFRHALVRGALGAIEIVLTMGVVACIASLVSARGRRLGDVFAGTVVVRERIPVPRGGSPALPPPPPWLMGQLGALDLSRVPDSWWLAVRQFLARAGQLDPQAGWRLAGRLTEDFVGWTGAAPPQDVHPVAYLSAVVFERQGREARRAFGGEGAGQGAVPGPVAASASPGPAPAVPSAAVPSAATGTGPWATPGGAPAASDVPPVAPVAPVASSAVVSSAESSAGAGSGRTAGPGRAAGPDDRTAEPGRRTGFAPPA
ncbi:RDD family protein [Streptomyces sp. Ru73]|uniref:RDD family protein n=1 Tax=Streptomyces sp. Ru73 TaxID=2080748 RepID=UPI000CDD018C|nr:RDD family protein [Streptomyces sp. Ru73]POX39684.1 RDD family protein [Streptomyces sp. Ru73]